MSSNVVETQRLTVESVVSYNEATDPSLEKVKLEYPKDHEGFKAYKNGDVAFVSPETAAQLVEAGIATIAKRSKEEAITAESNDAKLDAEGVTGTNVVKTEGDAHKTAATTGKAK